LPSKYKALRVQSLVSPHLQKKIQLVYRLTYLSLGYSYIHIYSIISVTWNFKAKFFFSTVKIICRKL
jgi:hypothetical protein